MEPVVGVVRIQTHSTRWESCDLPMISTWAYVKSSHIPKIIDQLNKLILSAIPQGPFCNLKFLIAQNSTSL